MAALTLLLSIHQEHADRIFGGTKHFELRRLRPRVVAGDRVVVYVPTPVKAVCGAFEVAGVVQGKPAAVWRQIGERTGLSKLEYDRYFAGADKAFAIQVRNPRRFGSTVSLEELRSAVPDFRPPQSYHYLQRSRRRDVSLAACW